MIDFFLTLALYLCCAIILVVFMKISITTYPRTRMVPENVPCHENTCLVDYALPGGPKLQPHLITVNFSDFFAYTMPAARVEDIETWVHEFVEATIAWILHKMFGHHDFTFSVVKRNVKYKHKVIHLITSLSHVSYMSMGHKRLSPNEYENMFFGRDTK